MSTPATETVSAHSALAHRLERLDKVRRAAQPTANQQLPFWPDDKRGTPNALLRGALFQPARRGARPYLESYRVASMGGTEVTYSGWRLDQGDLDAWAALLHLARDRPLGTPIESTSYQLLRLMGRSCSTENCSILMSRLLRLRAGAITVTIATRQGPPVTYIGGLLDGAAHDAGTHRWRLDLNPAIASLFERDRFTRLDWAIRSALSSSPVAQWLHAFYSTHAEPFPIRVRTLRDLCGSSAQRLDHWRETLMTALNKVAAACRDHGAHFDFEFDAPRDAVRVKRGRGKPS